MLQSYRECLEKYGSAYLVRKAVSDGRLYKMEAGVYSDAGTEDELEVVQFKYPNAVITMESAFFYYDLTDTVPDCYHLATGLHAARITDERVTQHYVPEEIVDVGVVTIERAGSRIRTYDLERLMIETARMKAKLPSDLYKEVVLSFRKRVDEIYPAKVGEYLASRPFPKKDLVERIIYEEIF